MKTNSDIAKGKYGNPAFCLWKCSLTIEEVSLAISKWTIYLFFARTNVKVTHKLSI